MSYPRGNQLTYRVDGVIDAFHLETFFSTIKIRIYNRIQKIHGDYDARYRGVVKLHNIIELYDNRSSRKVQISNGKNFSWDLAQEIPDVDTIVDMIIKEICIPKGAVLKRFVIDVDKIRRLDRVVNPCSFGHIELLQWVTAWYYEIDHDKIPQKNHEEFMKITRDRVRKKAKIRKRAVVFGGAVR